MSKARAGLFALGLLAALAVAVVYAVGSTLIAPAQSQLGSPPRSLSVAPHQVPSESGSNLAVWSAEGSCGCGAIVLVHGVRSNRLALVKRARMLQRAGYSVVLVDLQAHGESAGEYITFGHLERYDAIAAVAFARQRFPGQPVGVIGISLGGAAAILAGASLGADALVLEAVYSDITTATKNRLALSGAPKAIAPLLLIQLRFRLGISPSELSPINQIGEINTPVLFIAGTEDEHTTPADSQQLYEAAGEQKAIWWVEGAAHTDFHAFQPEAYQERVLSFFSTNL